MNKWYVITGGPSTGKTKLIKELEKLGYKTVPEAARTLVDAAIERGIPVEEYRADEKRFQYDVARLKKEIEDTQNINDITFFDRGMQDTIAYLRYYNFDSAAWIDNLMSESRYNKVFVLEPLEKYRDDYARIEDRDFTKKIQPLLHSAYSELGMEVIPVPDIGLNNRLQFILDRIEAGGE